MQTRLSICQKLLALMLFLCCSLMLSAKVRVVLQDQHELVGEIVFENEEVLILRDAEGMRHQIPAAQVSLREEVQTVETQEYTPEPKKVAVLLSANGGLSAYNRKVAGNAGATLTIGTAKLVNLPIVLGGQIGYQAYFIDNKTYSFLPISLAAIFPFTVNTHTPYVGVNLGYGIGLQKKNKGGLLGSAEVGWRYQFQADKALYLGVYASAQQMQLSYNQEIENNSYQYDITTFLPMIGLRLSAQL